MSDREDHRGEMWYLGADSVRIDFLGDPAARGLTRVPVLPPPNADDVRAEAARRIHAALGARDEDHARLIQLKAHEEAIRLLDKRALGLALTAEETESQARFRSAQQMLAAIRAASNVLEAAPPADYADDSHWPSFGG